MGFFLILLIVFINSALVTLVGVALNLGPAMLWPVLSILVHIVLYLGGDKICLALAKARKSHETLALQEKLQNCTYQLGLPGLEVFVSRRLSDNVYLFQAGMGTPSVVIGVNILGPLEHEELLALINVGLLMVKTGSVKTRNFLSVAQLPLAFPSWLQHKYEHRPRITMLLRPFAIAMDVYALPVNTLYEAYIRNKTRSRSHELLASRIFDQGASLSAAKQKVCALGDGHGTSNWMALVDRMSLVKKTTSTLSGMVFARGGAPATVTGA